MPDTLVRLNNVGVNLAGLQNVTLSIQRKRITTLIGPNGAGKTTLARLVAGLITPDTGSISRNSNLQLAYVPQRLNVDEALPVTVSDFFSLPHPRNINDVKTALHQTGASKLIHRPLHALSGGEMQRVLLARAISREPDLLILDEPAAFLDSPAQNVFYQFAANIPSQLNCGLLIISHDLHLVMPASHEVICLNGHICCRGTPEAVEKHPEYRALFGENVALYKHKHDHSHNTLPAPREKQTP